MFPAGVAGRFRIGSGMKSDIDIARAAQVRPILNVASELGIPEEALHPYGKGMGKVDLDYITSLENLPEGRLVLVTAINPTPAGEGKTTTTIGLGDALRRIGKKAAICLREPSLGPCFGQKGGATGGGYAQVVPMEAINLHFTGDFHAITAAHNLLAAMVDNHIHWGNEPALDPRRVVWRRAVDMNDRALRRIVSSLGGVGNGFPREDGFDITVASEIMAVFCLARDLPDLEQRLSRIAVGYTADRTPVTAADLKATGAMAALLRDAFMPNLVQTLEGTPAFVHGGPFANIAHGCNSAIATRSALRLADIVVTEAGFGADLGAEKFFDIKCRKAGLTPSATVVVATIRALKMHGGVSRDRLDEENLNALSFGLANLERHVANMRKYGLPVVVAINRFSSDTHTEIALVTDACETKFGVKAVLCSHWADGGRGAENLAREVLALLGESSAQSAFKPLYPDDAPLIEKIWQVASEIYGAAEIAVPAAIRKQLAEFEATGYGDYPVCIAKTQYSFSTNPALLGAPQDHTVPVRDVGLAAGAGFVIVMCGDILTMPGLPRRPAAERIGLDADGRITGLF